MRIYVIIINRRMNDYSCKSVHILNDRTYKKFLLLIQAMYTISLWLYIWYDYKVHIFTYIVRKK